MKSSGNAWYSLHAGKNSGRVIDRAVFCGGRESQAIFLRSLPRSGIISSFDTDTDGIGEKEGYGLGDYQLFDVTVAPRLGADFVHILSYFDAKRGDRQFSSRADISPAELKDYLPWIALLEPLWSEQGDVCDARVTLHGSQAAAAFSDVTGKRVRDVHKKLIADRVIASLDAAAKRGLGIIGRSEERQGPPPHVRVNMLYLPLSYDGSRISHFFAYGRLDRL